MARDNGSRGSYRHGDATELTLQAQQQQLSSSEEAKEPAHEATRTNKHLQYIEDTSPNHLSDHASDLLNAQFPPMPVPGSIPRRQNPTYGWKDITIAIVFYGLAAVGFNVIMCDGFQAIGGLLVKAGDQLIHEGLLRLGF